MKSNQKNRNMKSENSRERTQKMKELYLKEIDEGRGEPVRESQSRL